MLTFQGVDISSGAIRNVFTLPDGPELNKWHALVDAWINHYAAIGCPIIRVFAREGPKGHLRKGGHRQRRPQLEKACERAGRKGIILALENHDFLMDSQRLTTIVERVQSPWFAVNLDSGNFTDKDPYAAFERTAPYAATVQLKVELRNAQGQKVPADLGRLVKILKAAKYRGYVVLEYEAAEDPYKAVPEYLAQTSSASSRPATATGRQFASAQIAARDNQILELNEELFQYKAAQPSYSPTANTKPVASTIEDMGHHVIDFAVGYLEFLRITEQTSHQLSRRPLDRSHI